MTKKVERIGEGRASLVLRYLRQDESAASIAPRAGRRGKHRALGRWDHRPGNSGDLLNLEDSRRLGDHWKMELEARFFENVPRSDVALFGLSWDSYVKINLQCFF